MKRQSIEWDKIFASYSSDKQVLYRKYRAKNYQKWTNSLIYKWTNESDRQFSKREV
jgi:hypothetical protein